MSSRTPRLRPDVLARALAKLRRLPHGRPGRSEPTLLGVELARIAAENA